MLRRDFRALIKYQNKRTLKIKTAKTLPTPMPALLPVLREVDVALAGVDIAEGVFDGVFDDAVGDVVDDVLGNGFDGKSVVMVDRPPLDIIVVPVTVNWLTTAQNDLVIVENRNANSVW